MHRNEKELIVELLQKFEEACYVYQGIECWSARELQLILGYNKWENFVKVIEKPKRLLIIRLKELFTSLRQEHLCLDDIQRLIKETKLLQQEFQVVCDMESKSFEASSTFTTIQEIQQWLDQRYKKFYIDKPSYQKHFDKADLEFIQTWFNEKMYETIRDKMIFRTFWIC